MSEPTARWQEVKDMMQERIQGPVTLGRYLSYWFENSPRRALHYMAYYKFAAKMIGKNKRVLDIGCSEGLGTWLLGVECGFARGIDIVDENLAMAQANWPDPGVEFVCEDFLQSPPQAWDAVVSFDTIEHILPAHTERWWLQITSNLAHDGIAMIGTPSLISQQYASEISKAGHLNVYSPERLEAEMRQYFWHVFMFAAHDEVIHTGFLPLAHYLLFMGCKKKV